MFYVCMVFEFGVFCVRDLVSVLWICLLFEFVLWWVVMIFYGVVVVFGFGDCWVLGFCFVWDRESSGVFYFYFLCCFLCFDFFFSVILCFFCLFGFGVIRVVVLWMWGCFVFFFVDLRLCDWIRCGCGDVRS